MKVFDNKFLEDLIIDANNSPRRRQHHNIHNSYEDPCQRLFNAIGPESYIRPHRHSRDPKDELLVGVLGSMALLTFDGYGRVTNVIRFGESRFGKEFASAVEVPANIWHTVIAYDTVSILLEIKAGPFNPSTPKDLATWAPDETDSSAKQYLETLISISMDW